MRVMLFCVNLLQSRAAKLHTAHHRDDLIESAAINILRGTGWRGLAPLRNPEIIRPLLDWTKCDIYRYAAEHQLHFREDQTNYRVKFYVIAYDSALSLTDDNTKNQFTTLCSAPTHACDAD